MRLYLLYAMGAGIAWGVGGYFEKAGLRELGIPPVAGITLRTLVAALLLGVLSIPAWRAADLAPNPSAWLMIIVGGGVLAGSLGMWSFYSALSTTDNLGITLAIAFAFAPLSGTLLGVFRGTQPMNTGTVLGFGAIIAGIILLQLARNHQ